MCGIGGWLGTLPDSENYAGRMVQALHHRGPDAHGIKSWPEATLVHTRLSIIDLSPTGAQPMANEDGTIWTVFNGEIYNHRELRRSLESRGHVFKGRSDTEVLPHLYEEHGADFVKKLRGMFALAIYDRKTRTLILARDRFGIKPLFYAPGRDWMIFASEIRALKEIPGIDIRPDSQAIYDFAALFYIPAPETFYTGIRAEPAMTLDHASARTDALLTAAVCRQMESDVPLGTLLSGGIDSSLVSASAQTTLGEGLRTFNVKFSEKEYDETWAAEAVAKHIGSHHETLLMENSRGTWDHVTGLLLHAGQPFADASLFPVNAVCQLMRRHVTVALSGDGGDEGFGGYNFYWQIGTIALLQRLPVSIWQGVTAALAPLTNMRIVSERLAQRLGELAGADDTAVVQNLFCWVRDEEQKRLCRNADWLPVRRLFEQQWEYHLEPKASRLERLSALATEANVRLMLPNDFLFKVDTASMKESLEVRVPMLDEDLFAFGLSLPHRLKVNGRTCKRVLRAVAKRRLPPSVANKPKWGFAMPVDSWVDAGFKVHLRDALLGPSSRLPEFFRPEAYRPMVEAFCEGDAHPGISRQGLYQRAIMLLGVQLAVEESAL
jgi:asparagine synthase (glutamine-hydrolysing)